MQKDRRPYYKDEVYFIIIKRGIRIVVYRNKIKIGAGPAEGRA